MSTPKSPDSEPPSKRLVNAARELIREAAHLLKRKGKHLSAAEREELDAALKAAIALLPARGHTGGTERTLSAAMEHLEQTFQRQLGPYRKTWLREYVEAISWAIVLALLIRSFIFEAFSIPSGSMIPTLEIGDRLFVNKIGYGLYVPFSPNRWLHWDEPERGDVIVFEFQCEGDENHGEDYIKRIVATEGDRVRLDNNRLFVNGSPLPTEEQGATSCDIYEPGVTSITAVHAGNCQCVRQEETVEDFTYTTQHMAPNARLDSLARCPNRPDWPLRRPFVTGRCRYYGDEASNEHWPDVVVPEGHVFVMGDNRDRSEDGRYWGVVPYNNIKGTAFLVWWPPSRFLTWLN
jgi:signal peptidase I